MPATEVLARLEQHSIPAGLINTAPDIAADDHIAARDMILRLAAGFASTVPMAGVVPKLTRTPGAVRHVGPALGADTDAVLRDLLGMSADAVGGAARRRRDRLTGRAVRRWRGLGAVEDRLGRYLELGRARR